MTVSALTLTTAVSCQNHQHRSSQLVCPYGPVLSRQCILPRSILVQRTDSREIKTHAGGVSMRVLSLSVATLAFVADSVTAAGARPMVMGLRK